MACVVIRLSGSTSTPSRASRVKHSSDEMLRRDLSVLILWHYAATVYLGLVVVIWYIHRHWVYRVVFDDNVGISVT